MSWKFTVRYSQYGTGLSESWYLLTEDPSVITKVVNNYTTLRLAMIPPTATLQDVRVGRSQMTNLPSDGRDHLRQSNLYLTGTTPFFGGGAITVAGPNGTFPTTPTARSPAQSNISLQMRVVLSSDRKSTRYLVWPPHDTLRPDPVGVDISLDPQYLAALTALQQFVIAGDPWASGGGPLWVKAVVPPTTGNNFPIRAWGYQSTFPSNIGFALDNTNVAGFVPGTRVAITGVTRKPAPSQGGSRKLISINGTWYIDTVVVDSPVAGQTTFFLKNTSGIDVSLIKMPGYAQLYRFALYSAKLMYAIRCRTHKRGKDWSQPAGRRLTRPTADP